MRVEKEPCVEIDLRRQLKQALGPRWTTRLRCLQRGKRLPRWGNLRNTHPFSDYFGFDRGTPVDRYYVHRFYHQNCAWVTGDVLEIQGTGYTRRYGHDLRRAESLDIDPAVNPTFLCDLARAETVLPADSYDCFLLPNSFQHVRDLEPAMRQALRIVRPGGAILATVPAFVPLISDGPQYWMMSAEGWGQLAARVWDGAEVEVCAYGNCLAAIAAMLGLAMEELSEAELQHQDDRYPVMVTILCRKQREKCLAL